MFAKPLRTYQRKNVKNTFTSVERAVIPFENHNVETSLLKNSSNSSYDSLNDPFETTFDRIAKEVVIPPRPPDTSNQDGSFHTSSDNDTDIDNKSQEKTFEHISLALSKCNSTSKCVHLTHSNIGKNWKYRSPRKRKQEVVPKKTVSKKARTTSRNKTQEKSKQPQKTQGWKKQASRTQRNKQKRQLEECRNLHDKERLHIYSDTVSILEDAIQKKDVSCKKKCSDQSVLMNDETSQTGSVRSGCSVADSKYISNCVQDIKPCFVKLNACAVQHWHTLHHKQSLKDKQDAYCNIVSCADTAQTDKNSLTVKKSDAQSISLKDDNVKRFKRTLIKSCSVVLNDNVVKHWVLKNKRNVNSVAAEDEQTSHNLSEIVVCNSSIFYPYVTKRNKGKLAKIKETVNQVDAPSTKREQSVISSTPSNKRANSVIAAEDEQTSHNLSEIAAPDSSMFLPYVTKRNRGKFAKTKKETVKQIDAASTKRKQSIISSTPIKRVRDSLPFCSIVLSPVRIDERLEHPPKRDISNIVSSGHGDFCSDKLSGKKRKETDTDMQEKQMQILLLSQQTQIIEDASDESFESLKRDVSSIVSFNSLDQKNFCSLNKIPEERDVETDIQEEQTQVILLSQQIKNSFVKVEKMITEDEEIYTALTQKLNAQCDTERAFTCSLRVRPVEDIDQSRSLFSDTTADYKYSVSYATEDNRINEHLEEHLSSSQPLLNCFETVNNSTWPCDNDTDRKEVEKIFLKSGKHWARSLSILTNINNEENLDEMCIGKGKKWRTSVRDVLDMQKQGALQSCLKVDKDATNLSCYAIDESIMPSLDANKCTAIINPMSHARLSKRISVRVVPNNTNTKCDMKDTPFLEAFGIVEEKSNAKPHREKLSLDSDAIINRESATARNVVLQKCSQSCYLSFSECFPDSYLEHCHKIGEGVYGEVFLYEHNSNKSVLKIIPIEGKEVVNGEPQKKFNEILSEIVIAKELANLKSNNTYRTDGFVEVKNVNCVIGKYPKRLVELWNVYDDNKTSDNDCPSMFGENQLYITLELSHGGQDLEAFVFQTAEEACAVFLQIALALAVGEKALEFEHRDLHWGNVLISRTKEPYIHYIFNEKEVKLPSKGMKVSIIDFTLSRMSYQGCCIYNDLSVDPTLFTAHGDYQFDIYRFMRDKIRNTWRKFEPYTNVLWLHYTLDKMITAVRYKKKSIRIHKNAINKLKEFKDTILQYDSAFDFVINSDSIEFDDCTRSV